jgi:uncharacterized protein YbcI
MKNIHTINGLVKSAIKVQSGLHQTKHLMEPMIGTTIIAILADIDGAL